MFEAEQTSSNLQADSGLRNRVPPHATTQDWLILILILTTVVAQRIIIAGPSGPLTIGNLPHFHPPKSTHVPLCSLPTAN